MPNTAGPDRSSPYQDLQLPVERRVEDLLARMEPVDKAGLMSYDTVTMGSTCELAGPDNPIHRPPSAQVIATRRMNPFNLLGPVPDVRDLVAGPNRVHDMARHTPLGIPVTLSTDPRYFFSTNPATAARAGAFSQWPESLGFAALRDPDLVERFAGAARQEHVAGGLRLALHPQVDPATEPRWSRSGMTFGEDADLTSALVGAHVRGFQVSGSARTRSRSHRRAAVPGSATGWSRR